MPYVRRSGGMGIRSRLHQAVLSYLASSSLGLISLVSPVSGEAKERPCRSHGALALPLELSLHLRPVDTHNGDDGPDRIVVSRNSAADSTLMQQARVRCNVAAARTRKRMVSTAMTMAAQAERC